MPDITMCKNSRCALNTSCYRYQATPDKYRQSYFTDLEPIVNEDGDASCEYYYPYESCDHCGGVEFHRRDCIILAKL